MNLGAWASSLQQRFPTPTIGELFVRNGAWITPPLAMASAQTNKVLYPYVNQYLRKTVWAQGSTTSFVSAADYGTCDVPDGYDTPTIISYDTTTMFDSYGLQIAGAPRAGDDTQTVDTQPGSTFLLGMVGYAGALPYQTNSFMGDGLQAAPYGTFPFPTPDGQVHQPPGSPDKHVNIPKITIKIGNGLGFVTPTTPPPPNTPVLFQGGKAVAVIPDTNTPPTGNASGINSTPTGVSVSLAPNNPGLAFSGPAGIGLQTIPGGSGSPGGPNSGTYAAGRGIQIDGNGPPSAGPTGALAAGTALGIGPYQWAYCYTSGVGGTTKTSAPSPLLPLTTVAGSQAALLQIPAANPATNPNVTGVLLCRTKVGSGPGVPAGCVPIASCSGVTLTTTSSGTQLYAYPTTGTGGTACTVYYHPSLYVQCGAPPVPVDPATGHLCTWNPSNCSFTTPSGSPFDPTQPAYGTGVGQQGDGAYGLPTTLYELVQLLGPGPFQFPDSTPDSSLVTLLPPPTPPLINNTSLQAAMSGIYITEDDSNPNYHKLWFGIDLWSQTGTQVVNISGLQTNYGTFQNQLGIYTETANTALALQNATQQNGTSALSSKVLAVLVDNVTIKINSQNQLYTTPLGGTDTNDLCIEAGTGITLTTDGMTGCTIISASGGGFNDCLAGDPGTNTDGDPGVFNIGYKCPPDPYMGWTGTSYQPIANVTGSRGPNLCIGVSQSGNWDLVDILAVTTPSRQTTINGGTTIGTDGLTSPAAPLIIQQGSDFAANGYPSGNNYIQQSIYGSLSVATTISTGWASSDATSGHTQYSLSCYGSALFQGRRGKEIYPNNDSGDGVSFYLPVTFNAPVTFNSAGSGQMTFQNPTTFQQTVTIAAGGTGDATDWTNGVGGIVIAGVTKDGLIYSTSTRASHFGGLATVVKAGAPADSDFSSAKDGTIVLDSTNLRLWARVAGTWRYAALT